MANLAAQINAAEKSLVAKTAQIASLTAQVAALQAQLAAAIAAPKGLTAGDVKALEGILFDSADVQACVGLATAPTIS